MININHANLRNYPLDSRSNISASANGVLIVSVNKNRTINNQNSVGVILSLSSQKASASAKSSGSNSTLKVGSRGSKVKDLQKNLTKLGYSTKGIDGVFGKDTKNAVIKFQKEHGLKADGIVGTKTQNAIIEALECKKKGILTVGSKGSKVKELQKNLTKLGYNTKGIDGVFGKDTKNAVLAFQKACGLETDGIVGSKTQDAIKKALDYQEKGVLAAGSKGSKVKELQKNLTKLGYNTKGIDGVFGKGTKNAVLAFQKAYGLKADGIVGKKTQDAIKKALKKGAGQTEKIDYKPSSNSKTIQKMLENLKKDTSLGLSQDKKTAMIMAAERLLNDNYEPAFVAGVLGNIQNEGTPGKFESSNYRSNPSAEPAYLKYMDSNYNYRNKFSGKSIREVGISAAIKLQNNAKASGYAGKFGLGMIQWTGSRTGGVLKSYQKYAKGDKPTMEECIKAEVNFMADELKGTYSYVYSSWKSGDKTARSAGEVVCRKYEVPKDTNGEAKLRANNASKIYNVMMK